MPIFQYRAMQGDGTVAEGQLEAGGRQEAFRQMEGRGLRPISLAEKGNGKSPGANAPGAKVTNGDAKNNDKARKGESTVAPASAAPSLPISFGNSNKISARMLENFTRLLSSLLAAGVPLSRALV